MDQNMSSVCAETVLEIVHDNEDRTNGSRSITSHDQVTSHNLGDSKTSGTCVMNKIVHCVQVGQDVKSGLKSKESTTESYSHSENMGLYISCVTSEGERNSICHELLLGDRSSLSSLDKTSFSTNNGGGKLAFNEISDLIEQNSVDVEISADLIHNNYNSINHLKYVGGVTDKPTELDTRGSSDWIVQQQSNKNNMVCQIHKKQAQVTLRVVGGSDPKAEIGPESSLVNNNHHECESNSMDAFLSSSQNVPANLKTKQLSASNGDKKQKYTKDSDSSKIVHVVKVPLDRRHMQEMIKSEVQDFVNASKSSSSQVAISMLQGITGEDVNKQCTDEGNKIPTAVTVIDKLLIKTEPQCSTASAAGSLARGDILMPTTSTGTENMQVDCSLPKVLSVGSESDALLNFLLQNGVSASSCRNSTTSESPSKIVTKYVFIKKSSRHRSSKKCFGILYKQAFKHYHGYKSKAKEKISLTSEKKHKKDSENMQDIDRKISKAVNRKNSIAVNRKNSIADRKTRMDDRRSKMDDRENKKDNIKNRIDRKNNLDNKEHSKADRKNRIDDKKTRMDEIKNSKADRKSYMDNNRKSGMTNDRRKSMPDAIFDDNSLKKQSKEARNKSREDRRLARELKKSTSIELNERKKDKKMPKKRRKKKNNEVERISDKEVRTNNSHERKQKQVISKTFGSQDKAVVKKPFEKYEDMSDSLDNEKNISRKKVWKVLKKKKGFPIETANELQSEVKRNKRHKKIHLEKVDVEIKQEMTEGEVEEIQHHIDDTLDDDVPSLQRKLKMRNRKDLTLQEKVQAIGALEMPGSKLVVVAKRFGVSVSAISRINKNKDYILLQSVSGDLNSTQRRSRECKDPELDKVLLRWYRTIEHLHSGNTAVAISNVLLKEKAHELAITMGKNYFPSDNWIIRWKNRHNIGVKANCMAVVMQDREELKELDCRVNISEVLEEMGKQEFQIDQVKREILRRREKPEELFICEHCGVLTSSKKKKVNNHLTGCPASSVRKDLTLEEKVQVVRALEQPGVKMVTLAKRYGVSASAISRIHKNRADILARRASGLANSARRRDRGSKEPEVEKVLCEWFKVQHELGIHITGTMIREKARDIAKVMGKDFWPSESWVFRWRHRNNVTDINTFLYGDSDEGDLGALERNNDNVEDVTFPNSNEDVPLDKSLEGETDTVVDDGKRAQKRKEKTVLDGLPPSKQFRLPRSVMCEKCGFVSCRVKNNRIKSLRHAKGCPDLKPRNELTYENRARMLKALEEPGATLSSVARQFGVSVSSMSRMNQKKDQILSHCEDHAAQKRIRECKEPEVAYNLYQWYMEKKSEGVHVTGPKLKDRAKKFAAELGREFSASSGWLGRWRHRYNIISISRNSEKKPGDPAKKRKSKKDSENKLEHHLSQLQIIPPELHQDSLGSAGSAIVDPLESVPALQPTQNAPIFIHQRFQNPWEITQQQVDSCVWTKEFLTPAGQSVLDDAAVSVAYTYGENISKPVFHNVFDSFSAVGYQVAMPLDSSMVVSRDYLKADISEDKFGPSVSNLPHSSHPSHNQHSHHLSSNLPTQHLHHHLPITHSNSLSHSHIQSHPPVAHPIPPQSPVPVEDDPDQQRQVMEAFKIMSSFAQKKSLGDQVQAALLTIEMSMKNSARKPSSETRNSYTSI